MRNSRDCARIMRHMDMAAVERGSEMTQNEQLCLLIDHRTSSTQLVLSYLGVFSLRECIKSLHPKKQLEEDVLLKVATTD